MSDFSNTKSYNTAIYPVHAEDTSGLIRRCEPIISPELLRSRYLKGIPLTFANGDTFDDTDLKDRIYLATNEAEVLLGRNINRESFKEKAPFDYNLYKSFIHIRSEHGPIISLEQLAIVSADSQNIFEIPSQWIEAANFSKNLINVIPLLAAYGVTGSQGSVVGAGVAFLATISQMGWVPAYWQIKYTAGLSNKEGQVPTPVNELIGVVAAIGVLSSIAPTNIYNSQALSQDGISQSSSGLGPRIYELRIAELNAKRDELVKKLKAVFSSRYFIGNF